MSVTLNIPEELLNEVMKITGATTKTQADKLVLEETIARSKRRRLIMMKGTIDLDLDLDALRGRI